MDIELIKSIAKQADREVRFIGPKSDQIKWLTGIRDNKIANPQRLFIVEGIWAHQKLIESGIAINSLYICPELIFSPDAQRLINGLIKLSQNIFVVSAKVLEKLCDKEGNFDGMLSACMPAAAHLSDIRLAKDNLLVVLDGVEIPGNAGTVIRSVEGAGADGVIFTNRKVRMNHPKLIRASQCTCFDVPMVDVEEKELAAWLAKNNFTLFLLDTRAEKAYHDFSYSGRVALITGSERYGISDIWYQQKHEKTFIPMLGKVDSLNVAIAATIVLYEASLKQKGFIKMKNRQST